MLLTGFLLINILILFSWFLFFATLKKNLLSTTLIYVGMMTAIQIVLTQLILGMSHLLYLPLLIVFNLIWSLVLIGWVFLFRRELIGPALDRTLHQIVSWFRETAVWENILLIPLLVFLSVWLLIAAIFLPPRGVDDLVYHLPPLYQYVQTHRIELLPLELRGVFAMPLNGDFLFLWPLIFFHNDTWIDLVQFIVALYGVIVLYAMARRFEVPPRDALFIASLFLFTPVVLGQAGSNYNDLITGVCYLVLLYAIVSFYRTGEPFHLMMAGLTTGFAMGTKYNMLIYILAFQPIIWLRFWQDKRFGLALRGYAQYILLALPISLYWFVRNIVATGYPFYPLHQLRVGLSGTDTVPESILVQIPIPRMHFSSVLDEFLKHPGNFLIYPFQDLGLGSFHGGFGMIFWGLGIPAIGYCIYRGIRAALARDFFPLLFWGQVLVGFYSLFLTGISDFQYNQRYILFVVGFGLLALGIYFQRLKTELPCSVPIIKLFCVGASLLAMIHLASYGWPSYQIKMPVEDWMKDQQTSEYKYLRQSPWDLPSLSLAWEPLDYLTRSGEGWSVYMALGYSVFWVTPSYGSHIQNRIWNFEKIPTEDPDAFIFHYDRRGGDLFYVGQRITPEEVQRDGRYLLVTQTRYTMFWVKRELLDRPEVSKRLADYYRKTFGSAIQSAESLLPLLAGDGIVIMASPLGYGLKYLSLIGRLASPVYLVPENQEQATAERLASKKVYTIGKPLDGFQSHPIAEMAGPQEKLLFYENTRS